MASFHHGYKALCVNLKKPMSARQTCGKLALYPCTDGGSPSERIGRNQDRYLWILALGRFKAGMQFGSQPKAHTCQDILQVPCALQVHKEKPWEDDALPSQGPLARGHRRNVEATGCKYPR